MATLAEHPHLVAQLDHQRNGPVSPEDLSTSSERRLWWRCPREAGHVWKAAVCTRTRGVGCPFCAGVALSATNALAIQAPELARQWHPTKNGTLTPRDVPVNSCRRVWWKCPEGPDHAWERRVNERTQRGMGCPFCAGFRASVTNSLATRAPELARQWHPT